MAKTKNSRVRDYRHDEKRKNNPLHRHGELISRMAIALYQEKHVRRRKEIPSFVQTMHESSG
jgi:hypothetical protein